MKENKKDSLVKERLKEDLESIFKESMAAGKLNVALKARELLAKLDGIWLSIREKGEKGQRIKPLSQWSLEELQDFLDQLEEDTYQNSDS